MAKSKKTNRTSKKPTGGNAADVKHVDDAETQAQNVKEDGDLPAVEDAVEVSSTDGFDPIDEPSNEHFTDLEGTHSDSIDVEPVETAEDTDTASTEENAVSDGVDTIEDAVEEALEDPVEEDLAENDLDPETHQPVAAAPVERQSVFLPMVLGGLIAAFFGFLVGQEGLIFKRAPIVDHTNTINELRGDVDQLRLSLAELDVQIKTIPGPVDLTPVEGSLTEIADRLTALERRPVPTQGDVPDFSGAFSGALEDFSEEFEALKSQSAEQQVEIARLLDEASQAKSSAAESEQFTLARAAISQVRAAFDAGQPFDGPLKDLDAIGLVEIPEILKDSAADGVATMANLQSQVPDAARAALSAARSENQDSEGVGGFLQRQLGIRSLEPTEGDDPDSVLSRVEAAINENRLTDALTEVELLPEGARAALGDWLNLAQTRASAVSAVETLLQSLPTN
ncbi:MAG: hypothetical protein ABJH45_16605 [Paracoccaceae bacterium]